jgi:hypothetical protein
VTFINDKYPRATNGDGRLQTEADWKCIPTHVKRGASLGQVRRYSVESRSGSVPSWARVAWSLRMWPQIAWWQATRRAW